MIYVREKDEPVEQLNYNWTHNQPKILSVYVVRPPLTVVVPAWLAVDVVGCSEAVCDDTGLCKLPRSARLRVMPLDNDNGESREGTITMTDSCPRSNKKDILVRQGPNPKKDDTVDEAFDGLSEFRTCPQELKAMTEERDFFRSLVEEQFTAKDNP